MRNLQNNANAIINDIITCYEMILTNDSSDQYFDLEDRIDTGYASLRDFEDLSAVQADIQRLFALHKQIVSILERDKQVQGNKIQQFELQKKRSSQYTTIMQESYFIDHRQ